MSRSSIFHGVMVLEPRKGLCVRSLSQGEAGWAPRVEVTYLTSLGSGPAHQRFLPSFPGPVEFEELEMIL